MATTDAKTQPLAKEDLNVDIFQKRILIVDDEPFVTRTVAGYLRASRFESIRSENDPLQVINQIREFKPDMILLDINMPRLSGLQLLEKIYGHEDFDNVIILMLCAARENEEQQFYKLGALGFIPKPFTATELIRTVVNNFPHRQSFGTR